MAVTLAIEDYLTGSDIMLHMAKLFGRVSVEYQKQSFELIGICREMHKAFEFASVERHRLLLRTIEKVDIAIRSAVEYERRKDKSSAEAAQRCIQDALNEITNNTTLHPKGQTGETFTNRLINASKSDKVRRGELKKLKARPKWTDGHATAMTFMLLKSDNLRPPRYFLQESPRTLRLIDDSSFEEVLWLLARPDKRVKDSSNRISILENAQFYQWSGRSMTEAANGFRIPSTLPVRPLKKPSTSSHKYYVLTDRDSHVVLDVDDPKVFGNIWEVGGRFLLKEYNGMLLDHSTLSINQPEKRFMAVPHEPLAFPEPVFHAESHVRALPFYDVLQVASERNEHTIIREWMIPGVPNSTSLPRAAQSSSSLPTTDTMTSRMSLPAQQSRPASEPQVQPFSSLSQSSREILPTPTHTGPLSRDLVDSNSVSEFLRGPSSSHSQSTLFVSSTHNPNSSRGTLTEGGTKAHIPDLAAAYLPPNIANQGIQTLPQSHHVQSSPQSNIEHRGGDVDDEMPGDEDDNAGGGSWRKRKHRTFWQWVRDQARKVKRAIRAAESQDQGRLPEDRPIPGTT